MEPDPDSSSRSLGPETPDAVPRFNAERFQAALARMPERRRAIFLAASRDGLGYAAIAEQAGLGVRDVERELVAALLELANALERPARRPLWRRVLARIGRMTGR